MTENDKMQFISYMSMKDELDNVTYAGVSLYLDGINSDPHTIASSCVFNEDFDYMRNYRRTDEGYISELDFNRVINEND